MFLLQLFYLAQISAETNGTFRQVKEGKGVENEPYLVV